MDNNLFGDYTTTQLLQLRSLCAEMVDKTDDVQSRADILLILDHIEEELELRQEQKLA